MSDIEQRVKRSVRHLLDTDLPKHKRVVKALKAFNGLNFAYISDEVKAEIESTMVSLNGITNKYELETFQDYKKIDDKDLSKAIEIQLRMCNEIKQLTVTG